jgi:hypothetical protein
MKISFFFLKKESIDSGVLKGKEWPNLEFSFQSIWLASLASHLPA